MAMSRTIATSGLGFFGGRALRLLGSGNEARSMEETPSRTAEEPVTVDDQDQGADTVDAVAGSEFVDDQIREQE